MWNYFLKFVWEDGQRTAMSAGPTPSIRPSDTAMTVATATDDPTVHHDIIYQWMKLPQTRVNVTSAWTEEPTHTSVVTLNYLSDPKSNSWPSGGQTGSAWGLWNLVYWQRQKETFSDITSLQQQGCTINQYVWASAWHWATVTSQVTQSKIRQIKLQLFSCLIQEENVLIFH